MKEANGTKWGENKDINSLPKKYCEGVKIFDLKAMGP